MVLREVFPVKTLVFWLPNKNRRMCLVGQIKPLPAVVNRIFAAGIRAVTETWLFPSGIGISGFPKCGRISPSRSTGSNAICNFRVAIFSRFPEIGDLGQNPENPHFFGKSRKSVKSWKSGFLLRGPPLRLTFVSLGITARGNILQLKCETIRKQL